MITSFEVITIL